MKCLVAGLALLVGLSGVAYCQNSIPASNERQVHPGTAILDSMGIVAGAPDPAEQRDARASLPGTTVIVSPSGTAGKQQ